MRIAFDYQIFSGQTVGGISRYITKLADSISQSNEVKVIAPLHQNQYLLKLPRDIVYGIGIPRYPAKTGRAFNSINHYFGKRYMRKWGPDIVHETFYSAFSTGPKGVPSILTVYDMIDEIFPVKNGENILSAKRDAIIRADHIIAISDNTKNDLINILNIAPNKITRIYLGFDEVVKEVPLDKLVYQGIKPYLLYVGGRKGYKNFDGLLQAYGLSRALRSEVNLVAFGGGRFSNDEMKLIHDLGLNEGQVLQVSGNDSMLSKYYAQAHAFIYPSLYEGFGLPPLEAMARNCPVVASDTSSMPEVIGNAAAFFNPASIGDMKHVIESVVFSKDLRSSLIKIGQERIKLFSWSNCARETLTIYKKFGLR